MRIITFNIQHGGGNRLDGIKRFVELHRPDTLILTEYRNESNELQNSLKGLGYSFQFSGDCPDKLNTILVASRIRFDPLKSSQRIISVRFKDFVLFGVYFPQGEAKREVFDIIKREVKSLGDRVLMLGDFNTGLHYLDESGKTFACADSFASLSQIGLVDSWRSRNPESREFSWYSNHGNGFRIDHVFSSKLIDNEISSINYLHETRLEKVSDHSALRVDLRV